MKEMETSPSFCCQDFYKDFVLPCCFTLLELWISLSLSLLGMVHANTSTDLDSVSYQYNQWSVRLHQGYGYHVLSLLSVSMVVLLSLSYRYIYKLILKQFSLWYLGIIKIWFLLYRVMLYYIDDTPVVHLLCSSYHHCWWNIWSLHSDRDI